MKQKPTSAQIAQIRALGFSNYEARIYVGLLQNSPATAYELSKNSGIARANVYSTCETLVTKKAAQVIKDKPRRYIPVPPKLLFGNIANETKLSCANVAQNLENLQTEDTNNHIWAVEGSGAVNAKIAEMIEKAQSHLWIKASADVLNPHQPLIATALRQRPELSCLIVLFGDDAAPFMFDGRADVHLHEGTGARLGDADNLFTITIDHKEALTAQLGDDVQGAHTEYEPIVTMAETIIRHDVYLAEIFVAFGGQINTHFGPYLRDLRSKYFNDRQYITFSRNLKAMT